jgi:hypothetical protein
MKLPTDPDFEPYINGEFSMVVLTRARAVEKHLQLHPRALALGILDADFMISFDSITNIASFIREHRPRFVTVEECENEDGMFKALIEKAIQEVLQ